MRPSLTGHAEVVSFEIRTLRIIVQFAGSSTSRLQPTSAQVRILLSTMPCKKVTKQAFGAPVADVAVRDPRGTKASEAGCEGTMAVRSQQPSGGDVSAGADGNDAEGAAGGAPKDGAGEPRGTEPSEAGCEGTMAVRSQQSPGGDVLVGPDGDNALGGNVDAAKRGRQRRRETPLQREHRLARQREYNNRRRSKTTTKGTDTANRKSRITQTTRATVPASPVTAIDEIDNAELAGPTRESIESKLLHESEEHYSARLARQRDYYHRRSSESVCNPYGGHHQVSVGADESKGDQEDRPASQGKYAKRQRREETPGQRERRLADLTEYNHQRRKTERRPATVVDSSASMLTATPDDTIARIESRLQDALGAGGLDECVCSVCDRLVLRSATHVVSDDSPVFSAIQERLIAPADIPEVLAAQYSCEHVHESLAQLLLSSKGVRAIAIGVELTLCDTCHASLSKESTHPPKFAIANGFFIGRLPEHLAEATWIETIMTQLVTVVAQTRVMRGGRHRAIRSHCMVFDATPGPPATLLPRRVDRDGPYSIVLAGPLTASQTDTIRKLHRARGQVVQDLLKFYTSHNPFYDGVEVSNTRLQALDTDDSVCDRVCIVHKDADASAAIDVEQSSLTDDATGIEGESEADVIERNILLAPQDVVPDVSFVQRVVDLNAHEPATVPRLQVNHSSRYASAVNVEAKMYPHLFPFGRGHPGESRCVHVSKHDCMRHYAMLSSRRFAQDPTFMMTAFARLSLENMYMLTSVKCKRNGSLFQGYETLSQEDLAAVLINNERRQRGERQRDDVNPDAARFIK
jgi:hypothetical protein